MFWFCHTQTQSGDVARNGNTLFGESYFEQDNVIFEMMRLIRSIYGMVLQRSRREADRKRRGG